VGRLTRFRDIDAVTLDAFGTLVGLRDPAPALGRALRERGVERRPDEIEAAFAEEAVYYVPRSHQGRDETTLVRLRADCAGVFLAALGADLAADEFAPAYVAALEFEPLPGVPEALERLAAHGLALAVVANWDVSLAEHLHALGLDRRLTAVVTSAEAGAPKPDPRIFELALERLGVPPERALHVGDSPADEEGARATGMRFAPAPLADVL
jgi:HAD superfamily hydrolase (TIGR01509 family)